MGGRGSWLLALGLLLVALVMAPSAAAAPANDDFGSAATIALPSTTAGTTVGASLQEDEPEHGDGPLGPTGSVWYSWTSPATPVGVRLSVCPENFGPANGIAVYRGDGLSSLTRDFESGLSCRLSFVAPANTNYKIAIYDTWGPAAFDLELRALNRPPNDDLAAAQALPATLPVSVPGTVVDASQELDEPGLLRDTVWYSWTPVADGSVSVDVCEAEAGNGVPIVGVFTGATYSDPLELVTVGSGGSTDCETRFHATGGQAYRIAVAQRGQNSAPGFEGGFTLKLRLLSAPANDDIADAQVIPSPLPQTVSGTIVDATVQPGETNVGGQFPSARASVWYRWTAPATMGVKLETCQPNTATPAIGVFPSVGYDPSDLIARSTGGCRAHFDAVVGQTYWIAISDNQPFPEFDGPFQLTMRLFQAPANDDLADAQALPGSLPQSVGGTTADATFEAGEPSHGGFAGPFVGPPVTVWYAWTAPAGITGELSAGACGGGDKVVAVYEGDAYSDPLVPVSAHDGDCIQRFDPEPSTRYSIVVQTRDESGFDLDLHLLSEPGNDNLADAQTISPELPATVSGTNADATAEPGEPSHAGINSAKKSVWYEWTPAASGTVVLDTCGPAPISGISPRSVGVYTGSVYPLTAATAAPGDPSSNKCRRRISVQASTTYEIAVDGPETGFTLTLRPLVPPANDDIPNAQALTGALPIIVTGTTTDASIESPEPAPDGGVPSYSVWYRWTPQATQEVTIDTCEGIATLGVATHPRVFTATGVPSGSTLALAADADEPCAYGNANSRARLDAQAGRTYWIGVGSFGQELDFTLSVAAGGSPTAPGPLVVPDPPTPPTPPPPGLTGRRAKALKKCKKRRGKARARCRKHAMKLSR